MFNITAEDLVDLYNDIVIVNEAAKGEYTSLEIQNAERRRKIHVDELTSSEIEAIDQQINAKSLRSPYYISDYHNYTELHIYCDPENHIEATDKKMMYVRMEPSFKGLNRILSIVADYDTFTFNLPNTDESIETIKDEFRYFFSRIQSLYITTGRMPLVGTDGKRNPTPFDLLRDLFLYSNLGPAYKIENTLIDKTVKDLYELIIKAPNAVPVIKDANAAASIITNAIGYFQIL
jgi:hypothetical protein